MNPLPINLRAQFSTPLDSDHLTAIKSLYANPVGRPVISDNVKSSLIASGHASEALGGMVLTHAGLMRATIGGIESGSK